MTVCVAREWMFGARWPLRQGDLVLREANFISDLWGALGPCSGGPG